MEPYSTAGDVCHEVVIRGLLASCYLPLRCGPCRRGRRCRYIMVYHIHKGGCLICSNRKMWWSFDFCSISATANIWYIIKCYFFLECIIVFQAPAQFPKIKMPRILPSTNLSFGCKRTYRTWIANALHICNMCNICLLSVGFCCKPSMVPAGPSSCANQAALSCHLHLTWST